MKKLQFMKSQFKIMIAATIGILCLLVINGVLYERNLYDSVQKITDLTAVSLKSELDKQTEITRRASADMASDYTLNMFLNKVAAGVNDEHDMESMKIVLQNYKKNGDFSTVFLVDTKSGIYYSTKGEHRSLYKDDPEADWYFDFMESDEYYSLDVDNDQVNQNAITVFVDYKMYDSEGKVCGVTGAGFVIENIQDIIQQYEDTYNLKLFIVDCNGNLQISRSQSDQSVEDEKMYDKIDPKEYVSFDYSTQNRYVRNGRNYYIVVRKLDRISWYLVVAKTKDDLRKQFFLQLFVQAAVSIALLIVYLAVVDRLVKQHNQQIIKIMNTDDLTRLPNRRAFETEFGKRKQRNPPRDGVLFLFDIDNFKGINDMKGHLAGDDSLAFVSYVARKYINEQNGIIARWGGDEFVGMLYMDTDVATEILGTMQKEIREAMESGEKPITISIGITPLRDAFLNDMLSEVDEALYKAKTNGKNQLGYGNALRGAFQHR